MRRMFFSLAVTVAEYLVLGLVVFLIALFSSHASAQDGTPVSLSKMPPSKLVTERFFYDGSSQLEYHCKSYKRQAHLSQWTIGAYLTNIAVSSNVATATINTELHGLAVDNEITVVGGPSGMAGVYKIATVPTTATFTFATSGVSDGTYTTTGMYIKTYASRSNKPYWQIAKYYYNGTLLTRVGQSQFGVACDDKATVAYE